MPPVRALSRSAPEVACGLVGCARTGGRMVPGDGGSSGEMWWSSGGVLVGDGMS